MEIFMTVGELAEKMHVSVRTLQYYDREGLLKPSARSEGGRRLYTQKDLVLGHQILSFKYLGFSLEEIKNRLLKLDSPQEVAQLLKEQHKSISRQIEELQTAQKAISSLSEEVLRMKQVDFAKYAEIVSNLKQNMGEYWFIKSFDDALVSHLQNHFQMCPEQGNAIFEKFESLSNEIVSFQQQGIGPKSEKGQRLAGEWWNMVQTFTGGDSSLLPHLLQFHENKDLWDDEIKERQEKIDVFLAEALETFFSAHNIDIATFSEK